LATTDDARVHCAVLKIRSVPVPPPRGGGEIRSDRGDQPCGRSLRTQQRARPAQPLGPGVPCHSVRGHLSGRTSQPGQLPRPNNQCSTNELPPEVIRFRCGSGRRRRSPASARCSLERR